MFSDVTEHVEQIRSQSLVLWREIKRHAVHGGGGGSLVKVLKVLSCDLLIHIFCGERGSVSEQSGRSLVKRRYY
jgi:hypothetical protein